ncbi:MAG: penicillin acylase family protein [Myxococcales bacterium]|nr:penicillin acylase family protein [Myxococcales bacterium]
MKIGRTPVLVTAGAHPFKLARNDAGVMQLWADDDIGLAAALGFAHAYDRCVQLCTMRIIGEGRLSACFKATKETEAIDIFMRRQAFMRTAQAELASLSDESAAVLKAYGEGLNHGLRVRGRPLEFRLAGYRPEPWEPYASLLIVKMMTYIGLAQCQQDMEKIIIEAVAGGVNLQRLKDIFAPHLEGFDEDLVALVARVRIVGNTLPPEVRFLSPLPRLMASNNWAVGPTRSVSGSALQANDPHLEVNRLPAIWYEYVGHTRNDYRLGISMPGLPGLVMGRTMNVSYGFTYGYMDMVDHFIEDVRAGVCRREDAPTGEALAHRIETIERKGQPPLTTHVFRSSMGLIEHDPHSDRVPDGLHLAVAYSAFDQGAAASFEALVRLPACQTLETALDQLSRVSVSANWLVADREGHIGYQQSGALPVRAHSGLFPLPAWRPENRWQGLWPGSALLRIVDPPEGILVTANGAHDKAGGPLAINLHGGEYRRTRIEALLDEKPKLDLDDMARIQTDLESEQAHVFLNLLRPHVPGTRLGHELLSWDGRYDVASTGAPLFEAIYEALLEEVFAPVFGAEAWRALATTTHLLFSYYNVFDRILLAGDDSWFHGEGREALFRRVVRETLARLEEEPRTTWGDRQRLSMRHILLGGQLPGFLGVDHGPIELPGTRATIVQGSVLRSYGRQTTFAPSYRFITDLGQDEARTVLAGGPSERPFDKLYVSEVQAWLAFAYKRLAPAPRPGSA